MNANLTCSLEDWEDQESGDDNETDLDEEVQQPVYGIGGRWRLWEGYPDIKRSVKGIPKGIFKTHVTIEVFLYFTLTFIITALKVKILVCRLMEGGVFVRDQVGKEGRHRFCISEFVFLYLINFLHTILDPIYWML